MPILMRACRRTAWTVLALWAALLIVVYPLPANDRGFAPPPHPAAGTYAPGEILVKFKPAVRGTDAETDTGRPALPRFAAGQGPIRQVVRLPEGVSVAAALALFRQDLRLEYAEPNYYRYLGRVPNDPQYGQLWGMAKIKAPDAWDTLTDCRGAIVAVIDSGADLLHPDLSGNIDPLLGHNFIAPGTPPADLDGHGTHVTGTLAAVGNNAEGVTGLCWEARVMVLKAFDEFGVGRISDIVAAMDFARLNGSGS